MAQQELFKPQKDFMQRHRNKIVYGAMLFGLLGTLYGWALLPEKVVVFANMEGAVPRDKDTTLLLHLGMTTLFSGLFWKWPREWAYWLGLILSLLLMAAVLVNNVGGV